MFFRYMLLTGIIWSIIFGIFVAIFSFYARYNTWKLSHPEIPKYIFFLMCDSIDYDFGLLSNLFVIFKIIYSFLLLFLFFIFLLIGMISNNGFFYFCSIVSLWCYYHNILQTFKPHALMALWSNNIPNPSVFYKYEQYRIQWILNDYNNDTEKMIQTASSIRTDKGLLFFIIFYYFCNYLCFD